MSPLFSDSAALPWWAVVVALIALSPLPMAGPSGIALAGIGLAGSALLLQQARQRNNLRVALGPAAPRSWTAGEVRRRPGRDPRMPS